KQGIATGASERNWKGYGHEVELPAGFPDWKKKLLTDPQTSGGLLVATSAEAQVLEIFKKQGFEARAIGRLSAGRSLVQTRSRMSGCASTPGWMRSGWNRSGFLTTSSSMKGTSAVL